MRKPIKKTPLVTPSCLNLPALLLLITFFLISFGQLQRVQLSHTIAFYGHDLFVVLFSFLIFFTIKKKKELLMNIFFRWQKFKFFLIWAVFGLVINQLLSGFQIIPWLYLVRLLAYLWFAISIKTSLIIFPCFQSVVRLILYIVIGNILLIGFTQYLFVPDLRFLASSGWDVHYYRMAGNMLDPNFFGMILVILLSSWLFILAKNCKQKLYLGLIFIVALALTYSRSSYLSFAIISIIIAVWPKLKLVFSKKITSFLFLSFILLLPFLPRPGGLGVDLTRTETIASRAEVNKSVLSNLTFKQLMIGNGLFTPNINLSINDRVVHANFPDNILVFLLAGTGVIGLILISLFFISEIKLAIAKNNPLTIILLASILTHSMFNLTILEPISLLILLLCFCISDNNELSTKKTEKTDKIMNKNKRSLRKRQGSSVG